MALSDVFSEILGGGKQQQSMPEQKPKTPASNLFQTDGLPDDGEQAERVTLWQLLEAPAMARTRTLLDEGLRKRYGRIGNFL